MGLGEVHRSKNGLKLTVRHVQPDIDRESLWRQRRETLERVETKGKRIQEANLSLLVQICTKFIEIRVHVDDVGKEKDLVLAVLDEIPLTI